MENGKEGKEKKGDVLPVVVTSHENHHKNTRVLHVHHLNNSSGKNTWDYKGCLLLLLLYLKSWFGYHM